VTGDCPFCLIADGKAAADELHRDEHAVAFRDINPQAPSHILVIPRRHIASLARARDEDAALLGHLQVVAARLASQLGIATGGYRCVINCGDDGGQTVHHLHLHVLGGRAMGWPPFPRS
jgi:histidine triad (HIT) family protein